MLNKQLRLKKMNAFHAILFLFLVLACSACRATSTPIPDQTLEPSGTADVTVVEEFYRSINEAQSQGDLGRPWDMMTNQAQCNPRDKCELGYFEQIWWKSKAAYKIYDCDANRVIVQEVRYPRDAASASTPTAPRFWSYQLSEVDGVLMIAGISALQALGDECVLVSETPLQ